MSDERRPPLRDYLAAREQEIAAQLEELRKQREPLESELAEVRRAKSALGADPAPLLEVARRAATGPPGNFDNWTLKQMAIRALSDHFQHGATAQTLLEFFKTAYGRDIPRASLSPQLSRLADNDKLLIREGRTWKLAPKSNEGE